MPTNKMLALVCGILLPPLGVIIAGGSILSIIINIILTFFLFWIGGVVHALYLVLTRPDEEWGPSILGNSNVGNDSGDTSPDA